MKNKFLIAFALLFTVAVNAQTDTTTTATTKPLANTSTSTVATTSTASLDAALPDHLKGVTTETLRPEHSFPALGSYKATGTSTGDVTITIDETNKGIVWVEGLSQGKFKALMKKAPSTYKIPAQQTEAGKTVAEGTLFLNPESKELTILLGRPFDDADPSSFLADNATANVKGKAKSWKYTGIKSDAGAMVAPSTPQQ